MEEEAEEAEAKGLPQLGGRPLMAGVGWRVEKGRGRESEGKGERRGTKKKSAKRREESVDMYVCVCVWRERHTERDRDREEIRSAHLRGGLSGAPLRTKGRRRPEKADGRGKDGQSICCRPPATVSNRKDESERERERGCGRRSARKRERERGKGRESKKKGSERERREGI